MLLALLLAIVCVIANGFFVAAEFALAKVRPSALEASAQKGDRRAEEGIHLTQHLDAYLSATQLGITLASLALGWLGEPAVATFVAPLLHWLALPESWIHPIALSISFGIITLLHIVIGELVPKSIAIRYPVKIVRWSARPLRLFHGFSLPILYVLNGLSNWLLERVGVPPAQESSSSLTADELRVMVQTALSETEGDVTKRVLIERVLRGIDRPVRSIMVPRVDMQLVRLDESFEDCLEKVRRFGFSRFPVAEDGNPDHVMGYIFVKDLLLAKPELRSQLRLLKRDILYVPESISVGELLREFRVTRIPMAIVVDEYGGTSGLITVEDAVEEVVGEIQDEHDAEEPKVTQREDGMVVVDGSYLLGDLELDNFEPPEGEEGETVGSYVLTQLGRLAHPGDCVRLGSYRMTVEDIRRRRVHRVSLKFVPPTSPPDDGEEP